MHTTAGTSARRRGFVGTMAMLVALLLSGALVLPAAASEWPSQQEMVQRIDDIIAQVERGELAYDREADEDEVIRALREVIPNPPGYPSRSIEYIVPWGAGGGSDTYARHIGLDAARIMGVDIAYNNMPGGSGSVALAHLESLKPDGYTIYGAVATQAIMEGIGQHPFSDVVDFIIRNQTGTETWWVRADSPYETWDDFIADARERPGEVRVVAAGGISDDLFRVAHVEQALDLDLIYIGYDGSGERQAALLGGHAEVMVETAGPILPLFEGGEVRPIAYGGPVVFEDIDPDVPSITDLGLEEPVARWRGMVTVKGTDHQIIDYLHNIFYASSRLPFYREYEERFLQHLVPGYMNSEEFREHVINEAEVVRELAEDLDL